MRQYVRLVTVTAVLVVTLAGVVVATPPAGAATTTPPRYQWGIVPTPNVGPGVDNSLQAASCAGGSCVAVGYTNAGKADQTLAEGWNGAAWTIEPSQSFAPTRNSDLYGVSCVTPTFCMAVGSGTGRTITQTLIEQWDGGGLLIVPSVNTSNAQPQSLYGVSCTSVTFCVAVGSVQTVPGPTVTLIEQWNGTVWSLVASPSAPGSGLSELNAVSCLSPTSCTAVGDYFNGSASQTLAESWNGTTWSIVTSPNPSTLVTNVLTSVSCMSATACTAVGYSAAGAGYQNLAMQWNGTVWTTTSAPETGPTDDDLLESVSCGSPTSCTAVGSSSPDGSSDANLIEQWDNGVWSIVASPDPSPGLDGELTGVACTGVWSCAAVGDTPDDTPMLTEALSVEPGYWMAASDGGIFAFGSSAFYGSMGGKLLAQPVVGFAPTPDRMGYWEVASDGGIFAFGDAGFYGSMGAKPLNQPIVGIASTADGKGYWEVARDGGIFAFGDAGFYGSMGAKPLNQPIVGIASTADGLGYWEVASDGGIFAFGDAGFYGSMGGTTLTRPIVGITATADGLGYWMVASDGGIFAFGDAGFFGSMGGQPLAQPIVGITSTIDGQGYWMVASDGGIFAFGDAEFLGSMGGRLLARPIVQIG